MHFRTTKRPVATHKLKIPAISGRLLGSKEIRMKLLILRLIPVREG